MTTPVQFKYKCLYRNIKGEICNSKCIEPERCSKHKTSITFTQKCIYTGCTKYTRSIHKKCTEHSKLKTYDTPVDDVIKKIEDCAITPSTTVKSDIAPATAVDRMQKARDAKKNKRLATTAAPVLNVKEVMKAQAQSEEDSDEDSGKAKA